MLSIRPAGIIIDSCQAASVSITVNITKLNNLILEFPCEGKREIP